MEARQRDDVNTFCQLRPDDTLDKYPCPFELCLLEPYLGRMRGTCVEFPVSTWTRGCVDH